MPAVLPGKPQAKLQAISVGRWQGHRIITYIAGNALVVLTGPQTVAQTLYDDSGEHLEAVSFDERSGKIAVCSRRVAHIYYPRTDAGSSLRWSLHDSIRDASHLHRLTSLSWGVSEELLLGGSCLCMYSTAHPVAPIWIKQLANPVKLAAFSEDATLIASTGCYDKLVKIWRRLSFSLSDAQFDFAYLPHPAAVTGCIWRKGSHAQHAGNGNNILYTTCADQVFRVWTAANPHSLQTLDLCAHIDLRECIQPRNMPCQAALGRRYVFIVDSEDFRVALEKAAGRSDDGRLLKDVIEHLAEVASYSPDICVVLNDDGHMSAWGVVDTGKRSQAIANVFNIAHVDGFKLSFLRDASMQEDYVQIHTFCDSGSDLGLTILTHYFDGRIEWLVADLDSLFDPSSTSKRLQSLSVWSGHTLPVDKIIRSVSGKTLVSRSLRGECMVWKQQRGLEGSKVVLHSEIREAEPIHKLCIIEDLHLVILLVADTISVWDTRTRKAVQLTRQNYTLHGQPLCLIVLPRVMSMKGCVHVAAISSEMEGIAWEVRAPGHCDPVQDIRDYDAPVLSEFSRFTLHSGSDLAFVVAVDPAGSDPTISGFLDTFARDVAIAYTHSGSLHSWTAKVDIENRSVDWLLRSTIDTGLARPSLASGSSIRKAALVSSDRVGLTIWDTREAQLEFQDDFGEQIRDLDWTSTPDNQSVLAVGFAHHVRLLAQLRYDYLDAGPAWTTVRDINLSHLTPFSFGDSVWMSQGDLLVGAGNQLFVSEGKLNTAESLVTDLRLSGHSKPRLIDLFTVVTRLNGTLPVFHPQFVSQCILRGKTGLVQRILVAFHHRLKFYTEGEDIDSFLGLRPEEFLQGDTRQPTLSNGLRLSYADLHDNAESDTVVTEPLAASLNDKLTRVAIPQLTSHEQFLLADIVECIATVEMHRRSLDDNASRFLLFFRQQHLRNSRRHSTAPSHIPWREIAWAYHSDSQDILVDLVSRQHPAGVQWERARESGIFMWIKDPLALRKQFEIIARNQYTSTDEKNPVDCSLFYLALRKKNILLGLWRMASWNPEQRATQRLLGNDFTEARWRTAALKNAYVLLGRHRYEYAAAFFLLADSAKDAVSICIERLGDLQLGIAIARVYEGDDGPILRELLEKHILPQASAEGNRWLATWAFWMLNRRDMAVQALISPIHTLLEHVESPGLQAKLYLADDPALVTLYEHLRGQTLQTLRGASKVSLKLEWDFVIRTARLYDRMSCDLLALDLVRNWEFLRRPEGKAQQSFDIDKMRDPRAMLRRRSSLVVADLPPPPPPPSLASTLSPANGAVPPELRTGVGVGVDGGKHPPHPPPSVFQEPDANSLLAEFGY